MQSVISAQHGARDARLAAINLINREFHAQRWKNAQPLLDNQEIALAAYKDYQKEYRRIQTQQFDRPPSERLRATQPYAEILFRISELATSLSRRKMRAFDDQARRAKYRRNKVGDSETPINEIVESLALNPEYRNLSGSSLVPHFMSCLKEEGCYPREIGSKSGDRRKDRIEYDFFRHPKNDQEREHVTKNNRICIRKSISIGRFETIVSRTRRASRQTG